MNIIGYIEENPDIEIQDSVESIWDDFELISVAGVGVDEVIPSKPKKNKSWARKRGDINEATLANSNKVVVHQHLTPRAENALETLLDYFINFEQPAKIVERKPNLDYYDNRIEYRNRISFRGIMPLGISKKHIYNKSS